jgi:hypothetical protein
LNKDVAKWLAAFEIEALGGMKIGDCDIIRN